MVLFVVVQHCLVKIFLGSRRGHLDIIHVVHMFTAVRIHPHKHTFIHRYNVCSYCLLIQIQAPLLIALVSSLHFKAPSFLPRLFQLSIAPLEKCVLSLSSLHRPQKYCCRSIRPSPERHVLHANNRQLCTWFRNTRLSNLSWVVDS